MGIIYDSDTMILDPGKYEIRSRKRVLQPTSSLFLSHCDLGWLECIENGAEEKILANCVIWITEGQEEISLLTAYCSKSFPNCYCLFSYLSKENLDNTIELSLVGENLPGPQGHTLNMTE